MFGSNLKILVHAKLPAVLLICFQRGPVTFQSRNAFTMHQLNAICSVKHPPGSSSHIENCGPRLQTANFLVYVALKLQTENSQGQTNCHFHPAPIQAVSFFLARQLWKLAHAWFPFGNSRAYLHRYHVRCDASLKKTLRISKHVLSIPGDYSLVFFPHDPSSLGQTSCSTSSGPHTQKTIEISTKKRQYTSRAYETFACSMFIFHGAHVGQQCLLWSFIHHLPNYASLSQITSWQHCKHVASITERLLRTDCCWPGYFLQGFLGHPLQHALWLSLAPLFAELSQNLRENILIRRPQPSAVSWSLAFGSLAAAFGFFLWDFRSNIEQYSTWQYQWQVQGCASGPWYLALAKPHLWKLGCYLLRGNNTKQRTEPQPNILQHPSPGQQGGSPWQIIYKNDP